jgi:hypothetical protein
MEIVSPATFLWTVRNPLFPDLTSPAKILAVSRPQVYMHKPDKVGMFSDPLPPSSDHITSDPLSSEITNAPIRPSLCYRIQHSVSHLLTRAELG